MADPVRVPSLESIPEGLHSHFVEVDGDGGKEFEFRPPSSKTDEDVVRTKSALAKERERAKQLAEQLAKASGRVVIDDEELDSDEVRAAIQAYRQQQAKPPSSREDIEKEWEARKAKVLAPKLKELEDLAAQKAELERTLDSVLLDSGLQSAVNSADAPVRIRPEAVEDLVTYVRVHNLARRNGKDIEVYELDGKTPLLNAKGDPGGLADLVALIASKKPHWVYESRGSGSEPPVNGGSVRLRRSEMSIDQKIDYIKKYGEDKYTSLPH